MAINREIRENLMRDATAYARRLMLQKPQSGEAIFIGVRPQGGWSVYFGEDPVYQFNAQCELRRVHFDDQNYAANDGKLYLLHRARSGGHVEIQRIYSADTERHVLADCHIRLTELAELARSGSAETAERFPVDDVDLVKDLCELISSLVLGIQIADAANAM